MTVTDGDGFDLQIAKLAAAYGSAVVAVTATGE